MARERSTWKGWIPSGILVLLILGVGVGAAVALGAGFGRPAPAPTTGQVTDLNWSSFTAAGQEYLARSREVRLDLSQAPVEAAPLGLADDGRLELAPVDNVDVVLDYSLVVFGGGQPPAGMRLAVSSVTIDTADGVITRVTAPLTDTFTFRQALTELQSRAAEFGWTAPTLDDLADRVDAATRAGTPYEFTAGPGSRLGVPIAATAHCEATGFCVVEYVVTPAVR